MPMGSSMFSIRAGSNCHRVPVRGKHLHRHTDFPTPREPLRGAGAE